MNVKHLFILLSMTWVLAACGELEPKADRVANGVKESVYYTKDKLVEWTAPPAPKVNHPIPSSYCYQALQDILCYRQPMPGWEHRIVGYQGTGAEAPGVAVTKKMPVREASTGMLPANRALHAKPLVPGAAEMAAKAAEKEAEEPKGLTLDADHESLPDPALAPQL